MKKLKITLVRSKYGWSPDQRATLNSLGFKRRGQVIIKDDHPSIRGMVEKVKHLLKVEEIDG